jgi:glucose/arabinose dehydrogenase
MLALEGQGGLGHATQGRRGTRRAVPRIGSRRCFGAPPPPPPPPPASSPTLTTTTNFVTGLTNPWDMAFLSDGTMFFTQRPGPVKVRLPDGSINDVVTPADVAPQGASGMMGIAVDPGFASNNFIYTCYTATNDHRVLRWQVNNTFNGVTGPGTVILQGLIKEPEFNGCRVRFGPDGKLWVTTGDANSGPLPQDLNSLNGKVLRITAMAPRRATIPSSAGSRTTAARVMFLDTDGNVSFATRILENGIRLRSAVQGLDGNLYVTTDAGGGKDPIWKVVPS